MGICVVLGWDGGTEERSKICTYVWLAKVAINKQTHLVGKHIWHVTGREPSPLKFYGDSHKISYCSTLYFGQQLYNGKVICLCTLQKGCTYYQGHQLPHLSMKELQGCSPKISKQATLKQSPPMLKKMISQQMTLKWRLTTNWWCSSQAQLAKE